MQQLAEDQTPDIEHRKWTIHPSERYTSKDNTRLCSTCLNDHRWFHSNSLKSRPPFPINANPSGGGSSPRSCRSSGSFFCTQQTHYIILSFVFTMKSMGSKLRKIKGHRVCHLETLLPSLLTHPEKGHAIIYLIPPPSRRLSSPSCTHPASQPAGLWTHCGAWGQYCGQPALCSHGWAESEWGRLARWNQTGVWFRGVSCEGWISYTSQCCFWSKQRLGAVPGHIYTHCDFFLS